MGLGQGAGVRGDTGFREGAQGKAIGPELQPGPLEECSDRRYVEPPASSHAALMNAFS
jgi:hypothetical protein